MFCYVSKGLNPISCNDNVRAIPRFRYPLLIRSANEAEIDLYRNRSRRCTISRGGVKKYPRGRWTSAVIIIIASPSR